MLKSKQIITTEDLLDWSVVPFSPTQAYVLGNTIKDYTTGEVYKCIANGAAANTPLTNTVFFSPLSGTSLPPLPAASDAQALAKASSAVAVTPANLAALTASSADAITGTDTNKFLTAKSLADTLQNPATAATNTKFGTLKTATAASAQAGTATDEALTPSNIPDITASDVEARAMTIDNKFLTPENLDALRAVLADINDLSPLDDKFMTDKHLVDWFTSAGRVANGAVANTTICTFPGGYKLFYALGVTPVIAAGAAATSTLNFPVGTFSAQPTTIGAVRNAQGAGAAAIIATQAAAISATQWQTNAINLSAVASAATFVYVFFGKE